MESHRSQVYFGFLATIRLWNNERQNWEVHYLPMKPETLGQDYVLVKLDWNLITKRNYNLPKIGQHITNVNLKLEIGCPGGDSVKILFNEDHPLISHEGKYTKITFKGHDSESINCNGSIGVLLRER